MSRCSASRGGWAAAVVPPGGRSAAVGARRPPGSVVRRRPRRDHALRGRRRLNRAINSRRGDQRLGASAAGSATRGAGDRHRPPRTQCRPRASRARLAGPTSAIHDRGVASSSRRLPGAAAHDADGAPGPRRHHPLPAVVGDQLDLGDHHRLGHRRDRRSTRGGQRHRRRHRHRARWIADSAGIGERGQDRCAGGVGAGRVRAGHRRGQPRHGRRRDPSRPRWHLAGREQLLVRSLRAARDGADRSVRPRHGDDGRGRRRRGGRRVDRRRARGDVDRSSNLQRRRRVDSDGRARGAAMVARSRRQRGDDRRPPCGQQLMGVRDRRLQPRVPQRPAGTAGRRHRPGLRRRELRPECRIQRQPGELPGGAGGGRDRQRRSPLPLQQPRSVGLRRELNDLPRPRRPGHRRADDRPVRLVPVLVGDVDGSPQRHRRTRPADEQRYDDGHRRGRAAQHRRRRRRRRRR